jgi:CRP-like cAMP-binding protein
MMVARIIMETSLFKGLNEEECELLSGICAERNYKKGEMILEIGDESQEINVLAEGKVDVFIDLPGYKEPVKADTIDSPDYYGEMAYLDGEPRSANIRCAQDAKVLAIKKADLDNLMGQNNHIGMVIMRNIALILCRRLRDTEVDLTETFKHHKDQELRTRVHSFYSRFKR